MLDIGSDLPERGRLAVLAQEINRLKQALRQLQPVPSLHILTGVTGVGTIRQAGEQRISSAGMIREFLLKEVLGDYLRCQSRSNGQPSEGDIFIAKPWRLRVTPFDGKTIHFDSDGDVFDAHYVYTAGSSTHRTATIAGVNEDQIVIPRFKPDFDVIYAAECSDDLALVDPQSNRILLVDLNADGRAWGKA